jgi:hypothetical protein
MLEWHQLPCNPLILLEMGGVFELIVARIRDPIQITNAPQDPWSSARQDQTTTGRL